MNRRDYDRMRYNPNIQEYQRLQGNIIKAKQRKQKVQQYKEDEEDTLHSGLFSNSHTVLILTVVVGCFGVLWPKIFSPMFFGDNQHQSEITVDEAASFQNSLFPEHPNPAMRARMGGPHPGMGRPSSAPPPPPVRTIDKEWPDKHPRPGMRPTLGGPGIQPNQKQAAGGGMNVIMPIYTVAILVFFIYTIIKILFKNKTNEEEEDEEFLNSEYYKNCVAQGKKTPISNEKQYQKHSKEKILGQTDSNKHEVSDLTKNCGKKNVTFKESDQNEIIMADDKVETDISIPENEELLQKDEPKIEEVSNDEPLEQEELEPAQEKEEINPTSINPTNINPTNADHSRVSVLAPQEPDPRDLEIQLLRARLEQTEKTLQTVLAQMATINKPKQNVKKKQKKLNQAEENQRSSEE